MTNAGGEKWFFLTADYAFGHSLEENTMEVVRENGGEVVGSVRHPFPSQDFASYLLQAQGSGADVIGLANAGSDTVNAIKQASEFGITQAGQSLAALLMFVTDVHSLGADTAQGLNLTEAFYWDQNDATREWTERYEAEMGSKPTMVHAGAYSSTMAYLAAVEAVGSAEDGRAVVAQMREMEIDDPFFGRSRSAATGVRSTTCISSRSRRRISRRANGISTIRSRRSAARTRSCRCLKNATFPSSKRV